MRSRFYDDYSEPASDWQHGFIHTVTVRRPATAKKPLNAILHNVHILFTHLPPNFLFLFWLWMTLNDLEQTSKVTKAYMSFHSVDSFVSLVLVYKQSKVMIWESEHTAVEFIGAIQTVIAVITAQSSFNTCSILASELRDSALTWLYMAVCNSQSISRAL